MLRRKLVLPVAGLVAGIAMVTGVGIAHASAAPAAPVHDSTGAVAAAHISAGHIAAGQVVTAVVAPSPPTVVVKPPVTPPAPTTTPTTGSRTRGARCGTPATAAPRPSRPTTPIRHPRPRDGDDHRSVTGALPVTETSARPSLARRCARPTPTSTSRGRSASGPPTAAARTSGRRCSSTHSRRRAARAGVRRARSRLNTGAEAELLVVHARHAASLSLPPRAITDDGPGSSPRSSFWQRRASPRRSARTSFPGRSMRSPPHVNTFAAPLHCVGDLRREIELFGTHGSGPISVPSSPGSPTVVRPGDVGSRGGERIGDRFVHVHPLGGAAGLTAVVETRLPRWRMQLRRCRRRRTRTGVLTAETELHPPESVGKATYHLLAGCVRPREAHHVDAGVDQCRAGQPRADDPRTATSAGTPTCIRSTIPQPGQRRAPTACNTRRSRRAAQARSS